MNKVSVGTFGLLTIIAIVVTLFKSKTLPNITFTLFPLVFALILVLGGYYTFEGVVSLTKEGFKSTGPMIVPFVFSVLSFGIMTDAGMFDVIIGQLMKLAGDNIIGVMVTMAVIAMIAHMDSAGAAAFLIVIPAMLPVYKKIHMRATSLLCITVLAMGVLNLIPWAGPAMRAAPALGMEAGKLQNELLPIQVFGVILVLGHAVLTGFQEKARGVGLGGKFAQTEGKVEVTATQETKIHELARPKFFIFDTLLTIAAIAMLTWDVFPSYVPFMLGVGVSILVNHTDIKLQKKILNVHAAPALLIRTTLMGATVLMGIPVKNVKADGTEVLSVVGYILNLISMILLAALGTHLLLVIGLPPVPLAPAFDTNSYFHGMLPVTMSTGQGLGVPTLPIVASIAACHSCVTLISPMTPAILLGVGLVEVDIKDHICMSFFCVRGFFFLCMILAIIIGIILA